MNNPMRLKAPMGLLIDRDKPVRIQFEGEGYSAFSGDTIASALAANGRWLLSRSFKYHRPRGPLTMAGQDANTLVQLNKQPNVLADREHVSDGLDIYGQNYSGSLGRDRNAILGFFSRFMLVDFYYRAFFKPLISIPSVSGGFGSRLSAKCPDWVCSIWISSQTITTRPIFFMMLSLWVPGRLACVRH